MQIHSRDAVSAVLTELKKVKASGCTVVIGGHGMATTDITTIEFEIAYMEKIKELLAYESNKDNFITTLNLQVIEKSLYFKK